MERPTVNDTPLSEQEKRVTPSAQLTVNQRRNAQRRMKRQNETAEERSIRLQAERERMASTSHERNKRRRLKRLLETNEQRAERLADERERWYNRRQEQNQRRRSRRKSDSNEKRAVRRWHDRERWSVRSQEQNKMRRWKRLWEDQWDTELWLRDQLQWETNKQQAELCAAHVMEYLYPEDYKWVLKRLREKNMQNLM